MATRVQGIVVAFNGTSGVVLIKHKSFRSLGSLAKAYAASTSDKGFWLAKFKWSSFIESDRIRIGQIRQEPGVAITVKSKRVRRTPTGQPRNSIRGLILGSPVNCLLEKKPKWEAVLLSIAIEKLQYPKPTRRIPAPETESSYEPPCGVDLRIERMNQKTRTNLRFPWGGMGN